MGSVTQRRAGAGAGGAKDPKSPAVATATHRRKATREKEAASVRKLFQVGFMRPPPWQLVVATGVEARRRQGSHARTERNVFRGAGVMVEPGDTSALCQNNR